MPLSVNQIDADLVKHCGNISDTDISPSDRLLQINKSFWEIADKFEFREAEGEYLFNTVAGTRSYSVPGSFDAMQSLSFENPETFIHTPVTPWDKKDYESSYVNKIDNRSSPVHYYREADKLVLFPTPDKVYPMIMKYLKTLDDLISGGTVSIPRGWDEPILFGASYRCWIILGNRDTATWFRNQQVNMIESLIPTKAKEELDNRFAGVYPAYESPAMPRRPLWKGGR